MSEIIHSEYDSASWCASFTPKYVCQCDVFGMNGAITVNLEKHRVPNFFWRWMQFIFFGNRYRMLK